MITKLTHVPIFVSDQDEALTFYTEKLGFVVHTDALFGEKERWLTVCCKEQPWGTSVAFKDLYGNIMYLVEPHQ